MDEKEILNFWKENKIFEKSLAKDSPKGEFVFYDGPPFATGLPHYGSLLASIAKDVFGRYKTMRGYHVRRRWGWDCHGLPIENMIEKKLGLKSKKDIESMGVEKFNEACRKVVLQTADDWKNYIERVGRWVDFDNSYKTMDTAYMESVWWALKQMWDKELIYEGRKVLMYCPRCETPLSKAEVAMDNSYKTVTDEAVTVKFKLKSGQKIGDFTTDDKTFILAWTTTPWTLPANMAIAINKQLFYCNLKLKTQSAKIKTTTQNEKTEEKFIVAKERLVSMKEEYEIISEFKGEHLIGLQYEPLYEIPAVKNSGKKAYYVAAADFVTTDEGTGIVHIAPMYGEDDYNLGLKLDLPMASLLDQSGHFNEEAPASPAGGPEFVRGFYIKKGEKYIKEDLEKRGLLFAKHSHTHSYPHCHRCETPLYYSALSSWFVNIQKVKNRLVQLNEKINWVPEHLKHGRFLNIVEGAPDWNISRNRYWASPLPIWKCENKTQNSKRKNQNEGKYKSRSCGKEIMIGSVEELKKNTKKSGNKYFVMRHGEATNNTHNINSNEIENSKNYPLTEKGKKQVLESAENFIKELGGEKIDYIFYSNFYRAKETALLVAKKLGLDEANLISDERLFEENCGIFEGKGLADYYDYFDSLEERFVKKPEGGENLNEVKRRTGEFIYETDKKYKGKNILIVSHGGAIWMMFAAALGLSEDESIKLVEKTIGNSDLRIRDSFINNAEIKELDFTPLPHDKNFVLDLHKPYIDEVEVVCPDCGNEMKRTPEVLDGWFESGAMPFAEYHYPFENKKEFEKRFPGDFVVEYIAQTRTWFYYMHAISAILLGEVSFKNVISTGTILAGDGSKMSKSKGNYTDPMVNLDKYGADALRYYLMSSPIMQAEDINFRDEELKDTRNKTINILWNAFKFFDLYQKDYDGKTKAEDSDNVLDRWILAKLSLLLKETTDGLDNYNTVKASRPIKDFASDFSTWYIRRSRNRVKGENGQDKPAFAKATADKQFALATMRYVLLELSKLIAPFMPFLAEGIYQGISSTYGVDEKKPAVAKAMADKESVHLEAWPSASLNEKLKAKNEKLFLEDMEETRRIVSLGLEARAKANVKVRQPLKKLKIKNEKIKIKEEFLDLIKDELNVKEVVVDEKISGEVELDTAITSELKEEGDFRELVRALQDIRKKANLTPDQKIILKIKTDSAGQKFLQKYDTELKKSVGAKEIKLTENLEGEEIKAGEMRFVAKAD